MIRLRPVSLEHAIMENKSRRDMSLKYNFQRQVPEVNIRIGHSDWSKSSSYDTIIQYFRSRAIGINKLRTLGKRVQGLLTQ